MIEPRPGPGCLVAIMPLLGVVAGEEGPRVPSPVRFALSPFDDGVGVGEGRGGAAPVVERPLVDGLGGESAQGVGVVVVVERAGVVECGAFDVVERRDVAKGDGHGNCWLRRGELCRGSPC